MLAESLRRSPGCCALRGSHQHILARVDSNDDGAQGQDKSAALWLCPHPATSSFPKLCLPVRIDGTLVTSHQMFVPRTCFACSRINTHLEISREAFWNTSALGPNCWILHESWDWLKTRHRLATTPKRWNTTDLLLHTSVLELQRHVWRHSRMQINSIPVHSWPKTISGSGRRSISRRRAWCVPWLPFSVCSGSTRTQWWQNPKRAGGPDN